MKSNPILDFLKEIVIRLRTKSPAFFKVLQVLSIIVALVPGIPVFLDYLGVQLPDFMVALENKIVAISGLVAAFLTGLPVDSAVVEPKIEPAKFIENGEVKAPVELPFTDKH